MIKAAKSPRILNLLSTTEPKARGSNPLWRAKTPDFSGVFSINLRSFNDFCFKIIRDFFVIELFLTLALESPKITNLSRKKLMLISRLGFCHHIFMHAHKNYELITNLAQTTPFFCKCLQKFVTDS